MSSDTKAIIGTIIATGLVLAGLLSAQIAAINGRIDDLIGRISRLETDVGSMDARLRGVEIAFGKLDQRIPHHRAGGPARAHPGPIAPTERRLAAPLGAQPDHSRSPRRSTAQTPSPAPWVSASSRR